LPMINVGLNQGDFNTFQVLSEIAFISFISAISLSISLSLNVNFITSRAAFSLLCSSSHLALSGINATPINRMSEGNTAQPSSHLYPSIRVKAYVIKYEGKRPSVIINWFKELNEPRCSVGGISDKYTGSIAVGPPTANPITSLPITNSGIDGAKAKI